MLAHALLLLGSLAAPAVGEAAAQPQRPSHGNGRELYQRHCAACHQPAGEGVPGVFPPLARSDFLMADKARSIRIVCEGATGEIVVNGTRYNGHMPPVPLEDAEVAAVLTFVRQSWGNSGDAVTPDEVRHERAETEYATYETLAAANAYAPLPQPPAGFRLREVARLPDLPTRLASDGRGRTLYVLCQEGDVWRVDVASGALQRVLRAADYLEPPLGRVLAQGLTLDAENRLYLVVNQRRETRDGPTDDITIFRTSALRDGRPANPKPWLRRSTLGKNNHGASHVAFGPDGFLYVTSGSRTDSAEPPKHGRPAASGETPISACLWRLDPRSAAPEIEVFARGLRNAYGFCWNERGELWATDNGPHADCPEELNRIERGRHYGFPFQFSDWHRKPYPHTPDAPLGTELTLPIVNLGPAGSPDGAPLATFDPHSSPTGIVGLGDDFPPEWRGGLLVARFGNMLRSERSVGFDLLLVQLRRDAAGRYQAQTSTVLSPLARPVDLHLGGDARVFICEYSRGTNATLPMTSPGRILELSHSPREPAAAPNEARRDGQYPGVRRADFFGYKDCVVLENETVRVVLCHQAGGRVLEYSRRGKNPLWLDPRQQGWVEGAGAPDVVLGGGRFDLGPEFLQRRRSAGWRGAWEADVIGPRTVRLTSAKDPALGVQLVREFELDATGSRLRCTQTVRNISSQPQAWCHWGRTLASGGGIALAPLTPPSRFPHGYVQYEARSLLNPLPADPNVRVRDGFLEVLGPPRFPKLGLDSRAGWLAYLTRDDLLFAIRFPVYPARTYGEVAGLTLAFWYDREERCELEPIGPWEQLAPGGEASFTEEWRLEEFSFPAAGEPVDLRRVAALAAP